MCCSQCDQCEPGTYQDQTGQTGCKDCPNGKYNPNPGAPALSSCLNAPAGNYAPGTGNDGFIPCVAGTYQPSAGQGSCIVSDVARTLCTQCNMGAASVPSACCIVRQHQCNQRVCFLSPGNQLLAG